MPPNASCDDLRERSGIGSVGPEFGAYDRERREHRELDCGPHPTFTSRHRRTQRQASRAMKRICVFCGSHAGNDPALRPSIARESADAIVAAGYGIVYGGGGDRLDEDRRRRGASAGGGEVIGVIPHALARAEIAHEGLTQLHVVETMHERKAMMDDLSEAFVALPGGFGTMDEFCEVLTWRQLRIHDKPIGLLNLSRLLRRVARALRLDGQSRLHRPAHARALHRCSEDRRPARRDVAEGTSEEAKRRERRPGGGATSGPET